MLYDLAEEELWSDLTVNLDDTLPAGCPFVPHDQRVYLDAIIAELANQRARSAWERGVVAYAESTLEDLDPECELYPRTVEKVLLNGAPSWHNYSWGGCALIYDADIAERLCSPSGLSRSDNGRRRPNAREEWLDTQTRACFQAAQLVKRIACTHERSAA
ncbi:hypothetical protein [Enorma phocaeensis]|uniref:hypothetical protein n=1 Tax=Enorma phocaeensis TaxID=1871019 RepID=UPI002352E891|nr:hypothetical protein [Enorma phocaeensis]